MGRRRSARRERGTVMVIVALAATTLLLFAALALDVGMLWSARSQSQNAADSAALAAGAVLRNPKGKVTNGTKGDAVGEATKFAGVNMTAANPEIQLASGDVTFGRWNACANPPVFETGVANGDVSAVRVDVHLDDDVNDSEAKTNARVPAFLSRLIGRTGFDVNASATAYVGYEGSFPASDYDLPLAIPGCVVYPDEANGCCSGDFCSTLSSIIAPCTDDPSLSCLGPTLQNVCWTGFDSVIRSDELIGLLDGNGNPNPLEVGDSLHLLNGPVPLVQSLLETLLDSASEDDPVVVKLPVVGCQGVLPGNACTAGTLPVTGSICFAITKVLPIGSIDGLIAGHFLCADDPGFKANCHSSSGPPREAGGCNFGIAAERAVLVE